jgi:N-acyl homoserine lactone hydrolase
VFPEEPVRGEGILTWSADPNPAASQRRSRGPNRVGDVTATITAFTTGWLDTEAGSLVEGGGGRMRIPVISYLVEHAKGRLVFDTGLHADLRSDPRARIRGFADNFAIDLADGCAVDERIASLTDRLDMVVCSHLHFDHCGGNALLGDVPVLVQRAEWDAAHGGDPYGGYLPIDYDTGQDVRLLDGEHDVFGDGSVVCISTPGHTAGHQSLRVRTTEREVVLTGDACYFSDTLATSRLPPYANDAAEQLRSLERLRAMQASGSFLVFGHDAGQFPDDATRRL